MPATCSFRPSSRNPSRRSARGSGSRSPARSIRELTIELLSHVIDETPDDADGAAVAATTALFLADVRAQGHHRDDLIFFATQLLGTVARRHSGVETPEQLDLWMERLELKEPEKFLVRLRNVVDVLVQDDWWFDREALQDRLPLA